MFIHHRTEGIILKKVDLGEADRLFTIYTKDFGKLKLLARGERKIKSKLRGGLELFYLSEIEFIQGKTYKTLTDAILIENFKEIRNSLKRLALSSRITEVLDNLTGVEEKDEQIWDLVKEVFQKLNLPLPEDKFLYSIYYYFFWNLVSLLGYQPQLYQCSSCSKSFSSPLPHSADRRARAGAPAEIYFSSEEGGVICYSCSKEVEKIRKINPELVKVLRIILNRDWQILLRLKIDLLTQNLLKEVSKDYLETLQEKL